MASEVMEMAWTIAALLVLGLATAGVEIRRVARRRLVSTAILDELALLFLGDEITTSRRDASADPRVEPESSFRRDRSPPAHPWLEADAASYPGHQAATS